MHDAGSDGSVSNKETVKSWDDVPHAFDNLLKRQVHRFTWHRGILPRYVDSSLALHWHIALKGGLFFCCEISRDRDFLGFSDDVGEVPRTKFDSHIADLAYGEQQCGVLVSVYEVSERQKRFMPSIVRLHPFELRNRRWGNFALRKTIKTFFKPLSVPAAEDRKCGQTHIVRVPPNIKRWVKMPLSEFPHDVIKRRPRGGDAVANDGAQSRRRLGRDNRRQDVSRAEPGMLRASLGLTSELIWLLVQVHPDFGLEAVEVLLCPDDFESCTI